MEVLGDDVAHQICPTLPMSTSIGAEILTRGIFRFRHDLPRYKRAPGALAVLPGVSTPPGADPTRVPGW